jgi:DNA-binding transcriptional regulator LsrR (DeoR family)
MPMSRREIADQIGLSVEMVCRILSRLAEQEVIAIPNVSQIEMC